MSSAFTILLVDDNAEVARAIGFAFECAGHRLESAAGPEEAYSRLALGHYDAILLDLNFTAGRTTGDEGFACLSRILTDDPRAAVVVITAHSGVRIAVAAMRAGALDFVMKPWRNADLVSRVEAAIAQRSRPVPTATGKGAVSNSASAHRLLGDSAAMLRARDLIRRIGPTSASVTVSGPAGSGRSLAALSLHEASVRVEQGLLTIDVRDTLAWDQMSDSTGTIVLRHPDQLDEIAQMRLLDRLPAQARPIAIVGRASALTPRLRSRIGTIDLALPPLVERGEDSLLLARHFARAAAERHGRDTPVFTASAEAIILATHWADEVRGLEQAVERAILLDEDGVIDAAALTPELAETLAPSASDPAVLVDLRLWDSERVMIEAALRHHGHNISQAAAALGLSRPALYRRMARHGL
jgi:DNA-binding NtrC family response regulator